MLRSFEYGKFSKWAFNIGHMKWTYFTSLRVIPTTTLFSDIVSDISSGSVYGIYIYTDILSDTSFWHTLWHYFWHTCWFFLAYILTFFRILSGICSGIHSRILCSGPGVAHCIRSSRYGCDPFMPTVNAGIEEKTKRRRRRRRKKKRRRSCTFVKI